MPNELENFDLTVEGRIDDKVDIYSITAEDVGLSIREGTALARLFPALDPIRTYPKDWPGRDSAFNLFVSLADNVSGDTTIGANWQLVSSVSGSKQIYDLAATNLSNVLQSTNPAVLAYSTENIYIVTPSSGVTGPSTYEINALGDLPIKKLVSGSYVDTATGDLAGTTILLYRTTYFLIAGGGSSSSPALEYTQTGVDLTALTPLLITHSLGTQLTKVSAWDSSFNELTVDQTPNNSNSVYILSGVTLSNLTITIQGF